MSSSVVLVGGEVVHVGGEVLDLTALGQNEVGLTSLVGAALGAVRRLGHKGHFRAPEEVRESDGICWQNWTKDIREAIETRGRAIGKVLEERQWQFDAAISILCGLDTSVITATSDGKSFAYQILSIMKPESVLLCVTPLVALQEDQVRNSYWFEAIILIWLGARMYTARNKGMCAQCEEPPDGSRDLKPGFKSRVSSCVRDT